MPETKSAEQIIEDMKRILKERGWTSGTILDEDGKCCLLGAWALAEGLAPDEMQADKNFDWFNEEGNSEVGNVLIECSRNHPDYNKSIGSILVPALLYEFNDYMLDGEEKEYYKNTGEIPPHIEDVLTCATKKVKGEI